MSLNLVNLDERTRHFMVEEIDSDIKSKKLYISPRLTQRGQQDYPQLLKEAAEKQNDSWLGSQLRSNGRMETSERRKTKSGYTTVQVPATAPDILAEGEFNRFYIRGLCRRAIEDKNPELVVYRAKEVSSPRRESEAKIGAKISPQKLLQDMRTHAGIDTALGLASGPNSGLSVRLP